MTDNDNLEKVSVRLYRGDLARLRRKYPVSGASYALRELLRNHLNSVDEPAPDISIDITAPLLSEGELLLLRKANEPS
jgi:hypothetical protein